MFGTFKKNYKIQKAFQIARAELGIDPERLFGKTMSSSAMGWRAQVRDMIDAMQLNDKELAVMISAPFAPLVKEAYRIEQIEERVNFWANLGVVRHDIADHFLDELNNGSISFERS